MGFLGDMSQAVYDHAVANGYQVVRNIGGHGVGLEFHEDPWVGYIYKKGHTDGDGTGYDVYH